MSEHKADAMSLQVFLNCYLRECDSGVWLHREDKALPAVTKRSEWFVELNFPYGGLNCLIEVCYRSIVGGHSYGHVWLINNGDAELVDEAYLLLIPQLISAVTYSAKSDSRRVSGKTLLLDSLLSSQAMTKSEEALRVGAETAGDHFIESEQQGIWGHWFHPTPKNRVGMADWQEELYCPEYQNAFQLHYYGVRRSLLRLGGQTHEEYESFLKKCFGGETSELPREYTLIVCHPLQAQRISEHHEVKRLQQDGDLIDLGVRGLAFKATSSVRTVYHPELDWMLKLSIPVKLTNSVRTNKSADLLFCELVCRAWDFLGMKDYSEEFLLIYDKAYVAIESSSSELGFETLFRENVFRDGLTDGLWNPVVLFQEPLLGKKSELYLLVEELAENAAIPLQLAAQDWFESYINLTLIRYVEIYDLYGVVFESHLQNCVVGVKCGRPVKLIGRDTEGCYFDEGLRSTLVAAIPELSEIDAVFFSRQEMLEVVAYYTLVNHVFAVVCRFGKDSLLDESLSIELIKRQLEKKRISCGERGGELVDYLLGSEVIPCKSNLLTQLMGIDELASVDARAEYVEVKNPLFRVSENEEREGKYAFEEL